MSSDHDQSEETDSEALIQESDPESLVPDLHSKFEKVTFGLGFLAVRYVFLCYSDLRTKLTKH